VGWKAGEKGGKNAGLEENSNSLRKCYILENPAESPPF